MSANNKHVPMLCKSGCGFFGSEATGGCCSKCWMETIKKKPATAAPSTATADVKVVDTSPKIDIVCKPIVKRTEKTEKEPAVTLKQSEGEESETPTPAAVVPTSLKKKKKKKKNGYKNMMASMMAGSEKKDIAKEKELLAKSLGGGNFSKIEKI